MKIWKIGIAGAGRATQELTLTALKLIDAKIIVVGIADPNQKLLKKVCKKVKGYTDVKTLLADAKPDVLIINTPVETHYEVAMLAIKNKVNFILEKPATSTIEELRKIRIAAEKNNVKGTVVHNYKWLAGFIKAQNMYSKNELGKILHLDRVWMTPPQNDRMERNKDGWWHKMPGGRIADSLPHHLYVCYPFVGPMKLEKVLVRKRSNRSWSKLDETNILLSAKDAYVNIRLSTNQKSWPNGKGSGPYDLIIYGEKQAIAMYQNDIMTLRNNSPYEYFIKGFVKFYDLLKNVILLKLHRPQIGIRGAHNIFYNQFFKFVQGKAPNPTSWDEAIHIMELSQEISEAMENGLRD